MKAFHKLVVLFGVVLLTSCSTVPKEVVELSYAMGNDLQVVHTSYIELVNRNFDAFRQKRLDYLEQEWKPLFIKRFIKNARLVDIAQGKVVWSPSQKKFVAPPQTGKEAALLKSVMFWSNAAINEIEKKRRKLIEPLDKDQEELIKAVNEAFTRLYRANATITAHLNSLREVQEVQDEALEAMDLKDLRDKINNLIIDASNKANEGLEKIRELDKKV